MTAMKEVINLLAEGKDLTREQTRQAMDEVLDGGATPAQIAAFLSLLRAKGETIDEITGCAEVMKQKAMHIQPQGDYIDFVGTGGDSVNTFNITTTSVFITAAAGVKIAKHGNRAVSSKSGSIDLLEKVGVNVGITPEQVQECVDKTGLGFMFARSFNPCMKTVSGVRSELGIRTIFNILGPISNPSNASGQVIGVFDKKLCHPLASAMANMGVTHGVVVNCAGIDEFTTAGDNFVSEIKGGRVSDLLLKPEEFGFGRAALEDMKGGTPEENAAVTLAILKGEETGPKADTVALGAGVGIYIGGKADSIAAGVQQAKQLLKDGKGYEKLREVAALTRSFQ